MCVASHVRLCVCCISRVSVCVASHVCLCVCCISRASVCVASHVRLCVLHLTCVCVCCRSAGGEDSAPPDQVPGADGEPQSEESRLLLPQAHGLLPAEVRVLHVTVVVYIHVRVLHVTVVVYTMYSR